VAAFQATSTSFLHFCGAKRIVFVSIPACQLGEELLKGRKEGRKEKEKESYPKDCEGRKDVGE
jgi:hypothetical protein